MMDSVKFLLVTAIFLALRPFPCKSQGSTLLDVIQAQPDINTFNTFVNEAQLRDQLMKAGDPGAMQCPTMFVPTNQAMLAIQPSWSGGSLPQKQATIYRHILGYTTRMQQSNWDSFGTPMNLIDVGFGGGRSHSTLISQPLYTFHSKVDNNSTYLVNNAKVVGPEHMASNGIVQVVDNVLQGPDSDLSFRDYISKQSNTKVSAELWSKLMGDLNYAPFVMEMSKGKNLYSTYFVVTDEGWAKLPQEQMNLLRTNMSMLTSVLCHHCCPNQMVRSEWTNLKSPITVYTGFPSDPTTTDTSKLNRSVLVAGSPVTFETEGKTAQIVGPSAFIKQAVVHMINEPVGFIFQNREEIAAKINPDFVAACKADAECNAKLTSSNRLSLFVPPSPGTLGSLSPEKKAAYLRYMVLDSVITRSEMTASKTLTVNGLPDAIRFRPDNQDIYMEARLPNEGYVPVKVINNEQMGTNGVVQEISSVPALPYQTIEAYLNGRPEFSKFQGYNFLKCMKPGIPFTYFVPTNTAIDAMAADSLVGLALLNDAKRRALIFRRHVIPRKILLEDLALKTYKVATANHAFTREYIQMTVQASTPGRTAQLTHQGKSTSLSTRTGSYEFTNGWLYEINQLMYTPEDLTVDVSKIPECP
ncbi:unnamed protein product [Calicophoron daubneyi]|uniref:FAS1 domain-containing protein n=1 Tax=Calicophoron daubneyi TaxID=300641 RepID=A0AAV2TY74_CALDB